MANSSADRDDEDGESEWSQGPPTDWHHDCGEQASCGQCAMLTVDSVGDEKSYCYTPRLKFWNSSGTFFAIEQDQIPLLRQHLLDVHSSQRWTNDDMTSCCKPGTAPMYLWEDKDYAHI